MSLIMKTRLKARSDKKWVLFDIDGCILDVSDRIGFLHDGDVQIYHSLYKTDREVPEGILLYKSIMSNPQLRIVFTTARPESARGYTTQQLAKIFGRSDFELWMRAEDDRRPSHEVKIANLEENDIDPHDVFMAFDDKTSNVKAYTDLGIIVCHLVGIEGSEE